MIQKLLITFGILLYGIAVPILEINETHVFNPDWTPHVRIHEVWQLTTNSAIAIFCAYWLWLRDRVQLAGVLGLLIMGGFLFAFAIQDSYGGSMKYLDGSEKTLFGVNIGVVGFGLGSLTTALALLLERRAIAFKEKSKAI
ncbi:MAG: hypothetical protein NXI24_15865 [bacterium]|nr:hypothetical protein [bacterium]